jgi:GNAT superfamily N-acetyltransferase
MGNVTGNVTGNMIPSALSSPAPINAQHDANQFDCGKTPLNDWLRQRAHKNEGRASRTFVVCDGQAIVGFYALSAGSVTHAEAPKAPGRNMPPSIPVLVLGRMAVDTRYQGRALGKHLLKDALKRALTVSGHVGALAVLVHAIDHEVVPFYSVYGFKPFPEGDLTLFLSMSDIAASLKI